MADVFHVAYMESFMTTPPKSAPSTVRFRPEVKEALAMLAKHEGRSMANMLEWLIKQQCEREGFGWPVASANTSSKGKTRVSQKWLEGQDREQNNH